MPLDLVGVAEIAEMLQVSRQRVHKIVATDKTFPDPVAVLSAGKIWERSAVSDWIRAKGRA